MWSLSVVVVVMATLAMAHTGAALLRCFVCDSRFSANCTAPDGLLLEPGMAQTCPQGATGCGHGTFMRLGSDGFREFRTIRWCEVLSESCREFKQLACSKRSILAYTCKTCRSASFCNAPDCRTDACEQLRHDPDATTSRESPAFVPQDLIRDSDAVTSRESPAFVPQDLIRDSDATTSSEQVSSTHVLATRDSPTFVVPNLLSRDGVRDHWDWSSQVYLDHDLCSVATSSAARLGRAGVVPMLYLMAVTALLVACNLSH